MSGNTEIFQGFIYRTRQTGLHSKSQFVFTNTEGKVYSNHCRIEGGTFLNPPGILSKNADVLLTWSGPLPRGDESVSLVIYPDSGRTLNIHPQADEPHSFLIARSLLTDIPTCKGNIALERSMKTRLAQGEHLGGLMVSDFKGKLHPVQINPDMP